MTAEPITFGSLFAGIGGFDLGFERAGMSCRWQVEIDDYATKVLAKHDFRGTMLCHVCGISMRQFRSGVRDRMYGEKEKETQARKKTRWIDIEDLRKRHANSILNTATGRALGAALDELEELRENQRPETTAEITERIELALTAEIMERIALALGLKNHKRRNSK